MTFTIYQIDAFSSEIFGGNLAAVIKVDHFPEEAVMQQIASENNLSETAFVREWGNHDYDLRWFTPSSEIDFCGHATIASAHALAAEYGLAPPFCFHTKIGKLTVTVKSELYVMDANCFCSGGRFRSLL